MFGKVSTGMTNDVRGAKIRAALKETGFEYQAKSPCPLCEDTFDMLQRYADAVSDAVNTVESDNFLVGSRVEPEIALREKGFDFENQQAISTGKILGFKKPQFYSQYSGGTVEDFGVISVYVAQ